MDLIHNIKIYLIDCRKDDDYKDDSDNKLIKIYFKRNELNIPPNIQKLIGENLALVQGLNRACIHLEWKLGNLFF